MKESLSAEEREALLAEVRNYLPAFLKPSATVQEDPVGDVRELLDLDQRDLDRVIAVHGCLDPAVLAFGEALEEGLDHPLAGKAAATVLSQSVRGQIDWQGTLKHRARAPGELASYSVREPGRTFDTPENRALAWLLGSLEKRVDEATAWRVQKPPAGQEDLTLAQRIDRLREQLAAARRRPWVRALQEEKPTAATLGALRDARSDFYRRQLLPALEAVLRLSRPSGELLTRVLAERYFRPEDDGTLFEVAVALRLARAFADLTPHLRRRLLLGEGRSSFATYSLDDGAEISLAYQVWPDDEHSMRRRLIKRHGLAEREVELKPDIIIIRRGPSPDTVILELKASRKASYLRQGLEELLAYLGDRPDLWGGKPMGWLVAPASEAFETAAADDSFPLWVLSADEVALAATARFVTA
jgi:hypothetical protein